MQSGVTNETELMSQSQALTGLIKQLLANLKKLLPKENGAHRHDRHNNPSPTAPAIPALTGRSTPESKPLLISRE